MVSFVNWYTFLCLWPKLLSVIQTVCTTSQQCHVENKLTFNKMILMSALYMLGFNSSSFLKQHSVSRYVPLLRHIILIQKQPVLVLTPLSCIWIGTTVARWPRSTTLDVCKLGVCLLKYLANFFIGKIYKLTWNMQQQKQLALQISTRNFGKIIKYFFYWFSW